MKFLAFILVIFLTSTCKSQESKKDNYQLTISPSIDKINKTNLAIIEALNSFLQSKNSSLLENKYWLLKDFSTYVYPYLDIYNIENSKYGVNFYKPTLMDIIETEIPNKRILKIAFIGHNAETNENQIKSIYNIIANINEKEILFSRYLDIATTKWNTMKKESLTYKISPNKTHSEAEITIQQKDVEKICNFFKCEPIPIIYYSCINPKELFEIKGFDYHPMMNVDKSGGLADHGNIIFSGNNSDIYTHEIVHIYTSKLIPNINKFIDEGLATYMAGSGKYNYQWHRNKFASFLIQNVDYDFVSHIDPYERIYFEMETPIPYLTSSLILERTLQLHGKDKLMQLLTSENDLWTSLKSVGLTKENINIELRKHIKLPLTTLPFE